MLMLNRFYLLLIFFLSLSLSRTIAQDTLTLENAIRLGVETNFSIVLSKNNLEIAKNNNTWEWMLPTLGVSGTQTNNISNSYQRTFADSVRQGSNLYSNSINASALLNWKIFDGFNMFVAKDKLEEYQSMGEAQTKMAIEDVVSQIIVGYYSILLQEKMLKQMKEALHISVQRKKLVESNFSVGSASQLTLMQAQADLNADSSALIRQQVSYKNAQADLNRLIGREASAGFLVSGTTSINNNLKYEELNDKIKSQNSELLLSRHNERIAILNIDQAKSGRYPQISLFGGYNYTRSTFAIGFAQLSRSYGPTYGATFSWNLYGGGTNNRNIQNARIQKMSQEMQRKDLEIQLSNDLYKLYNEYQMNISLVNIEQKNLVITERNVMVAIEKYNIGSFTDLQLRDVQASFLDASSRLYTAIYQAKQSETELLKMSGQLLK
jgi:outer membrane protein